MELLLSGFTHALYLLFSGEKDVYTITLLTLKVSFTAVMISSFIGLPLGGVLGLTSFFGRRFLLVLVNIGMGLPPVVAGLWITMLLWRSGPLGVYSLLFTPPAIICAQVLVSLPIIIGLTCSAFQKLDSQILLHLKALGATRSQAFLILLKEAKIGILAAIIAGFGRIMAEVGAAMMVGGNIQGDTRILTTSIVMEVSKGNFEVALALSFILMILSFTITFFLTFLQQGKETR
jgi:tungstate transport system permease protein